MMPVKKLSMLMVGLSVFLCGWLLTSQQKSVDTTPVEDSALQAALNTCDGITERAAADLVAIVEFQRLEIVGRKARVFKMCMQDRGYTENPDWLAYSTPMAKNLANETNVSTSAAIEQLRRANMMLAKGGGKRPTYWMRKVGGA